MRNLTIGVLVLLVFSACSKALQEKPKSQAEGNFYNTSAEARAAVNAIYGPMRGDGAFGLNYPAQLEGLPDYGNSRGSQAPVSTYQGLDNTNINRVSAVWDSLYRSIRNANIVIQRVPVGSEISDQDKQTFIAEAKYLRAMMYFSLVRCFGGLPIRTEANLDLSDVARSSTDEVLQLVLQDALEAEAGLPDVVQDIGRPTVWAAKTLLTEIYLYLQRYNEAAAKSTEVISSGKFSLVEVSTAEDFQKIFGPDVVNTPEEIFYLKFNRQQGFGLVSYAHRKTAQYNYYGPGGVYAQYTDSLKNPFIKNWDKADLRKEHILYNVDIGLGPTTCLFRKFRDPDATAGAANDYPWYRYADLLLFHAEAEARAQGTPTEEAVESLNKVHRRAYGYPSNAGSAVDFKLADFNLDSFLAKVIEERGYETMYEGKRWLDLVRLGIAKQRILEIKGIAVADKVMLWPLPNSEILYNKAMQGEQNPGY
ncbi:RagB/SusD family nutrient uptake outer membrane protein [Olivibacter sp. CPCC 100613]|uniref:RagB/SusD family nutrient uptake outer membrane protein n=1 Tax=Olivibacter sp. CPCC 100613 TaxID=3079931 RepID=UPI002FFC892E